MGEIGMAMPKQGKSSSASSDAAKDQKNRSNQGQTFTRSSGKGARVENEGLSTNKGNRKLPR